MNSRTFNFLLRCKDWLFAFVLSVGSFGKRIIINTVSFFVDIVMFLVNFFASIFAPVIAKVMFSNNTFIKFCSFLRLDRYLLKYASNESQSKVIALYPAKVEFASDWFRHQKELVEPAIRQDISLLKYVTCYYDFIEVDLTNLEYASISGQKHIIGLHPTYIEYASDEIKADREVVLAAVTQKGMVLKCLPPEFERDKGILLAAVRQNGLAFEYLPKASKTDKKLVLAAINQNGLAFEKLPEFWQGEREIALAAVSQNGLALKQLPAKFQEDKGVVLAAVSQNGLVLKDLLESFKTDIDVTLAAINQNGLVFKFISEKLKEEKEIAMAAVKQRGRALRHLPTKFKEDRDVVLAAVTQYGGALEFASKGLRADREIVLIAVATEGLALYDVCSEGPDGTTIDWQRDREIVTAAVKQCDSVIRCVGGQYGNELRDDEEIAISAVAGNGLNFNYLGRKARRNRDVMIAALSRAPGEESKAQEIKFMEDAQPDDSMRQEAEYITTINKNYIVCKVSGTFVVRSSKDNIGPVLRFLYLYKEKSAADKLDIIHEMLSNPSVVRTLAWQLFRTLKNQEDSPSGGSSWWRRSTQDEKYPFIHHPDYAAISRLLSLEGIREFMQENLLELLCKDGKLDGFKAKFIERINIDTVLRSDVLNFMSKSFALSTAGLFSSNGSSDGFIARNIKGADDKIFAKLLIELEPRNFLKLKNIMSAPDSLGATRANANGHFQVRNVSEHSGVMMPNGGVR